MSLFNYLIFLLPQFIVIYIFNILLKKKIFFFDVVDNPDDFRKQHTKPTSCVGGIFFLIAVINLLVHDFLNLDFLNNDYEFYLEGSKSKISFYIIGFSFFLLGYFDDKLDIRSDIKTILMILLIYAAQLLDNELIINKFYFSFLNDNIYIDKHLAIFFTTFSIFAFINAINMYDGKNLQIGIYFLICLIFLILKFENIFLFSLFLSLIFFLSQNYNGKIFIGNNGTHFLGYIFAFILIKTYNSDEIFIFADEIFILMMLPGIDLVRLFFKRITTNKNPLVGDMDHIHHILSLKFNNNLIQVILFSIILISLLLYIFTNFYISFIFNLISYISIIKFSRK